jgi:hypothetical protein
MCPHQLKSIVDISGTTAGYTAGSKVLHTAWPVAWLRGDPDILVRVFEEFAKPGMSFEMLRQEVDGDTFIVGMEKW